MRAGIVAAFVASIVVVAAVAPAPGQGGAIDHPNFVGNGTFDSSLSGWLIPAGSDIDAYWSQQADRYGSAVSGGLRIHADADVWGTSGAYQCTPVVPAITYTQHTQVRVPLVGSDPDARASLSRLYFASGNCTGLPIGVTIGATIGGSALDWTTLGITHTAPGGAQSMWTYLALEKDGIGQSATISFDNVSVTAQENSDSDACTDGQELQSDPSFGGDGDPFNHWDFWDNNNDKAIDLSNTLAVLEQFGRLPSDAGYDGYYDRYAPNPAKPWQTVLQPQQTGGIDLADALLNLQSFGHTCV